MTIPDDADQAIVSPFDSEQDSAVPGELVVTLSNDANLTASQSLVADGEGGGGSAIQLGVPSVDAVLAQLAPTSIDRVHDEVATTAGAAGEGGESDPAAAIAAELEATYVVKFNPEVDPSSAITQLTALPEVVDVEQNHYFSLSLLPNDTDWVQQWGPVTIHCPDAWDTQTGSAAAVVAVVDSGVDPGHPDLSPNLLQGRNFVDIHGPAPTGWQYVGRTTLASAVDTNAADEVGHGTHVAGIIGAVGNNSIGVAGVVWGCKILPVRVMARAVNIANPGRSNGFGTSANIAAGIRWAADQGAKIINLSLGGPSRDRVQAAAVAYAQSKGVLVVAAMGNANLTPGSGDSITRIEYPAALPGVYAVANIDWNDQRNPSSRTGSHCAICAPGTRIHSTYYDYPNSSSTYADLTGTSMATPHVAGVAALIWSAAQTKTSADIAAAMTRSARVMPNPDPVQFGAGCVDCVGALRMLVPQLISGPDPESQPVPPDPTAVAVAGGTSSDAAVDPSAAGIADPGAGQPVPVGEGGSFGDAAFG